jgi:hypothetical protein
MVAYHIAPCCHKVVDVPVELATLDQTIVICPHCGAALNFSDEALHIRDAVMEGQLARLLAMLQGMQANPGKYLPDDEPDTSTARGLEAAPGVH